MPMWMNAGEADFHGMTVSVRRRFSNGLQFDFNYTLAHSIDNGSAAESGAGEQGAAIQDIYNLSAFRGSSDFDIRNNFNANFMYALPFGKGKSLLNECAGLAGSDRRGVADLQRLAIQHAAAERRRRRPGLQHQLLVEFPGGCEHSHQFRGCPYRPEWPAQYLHEHQHVEQLPGSAAGGSGHARRGSAGTDLQCRYVGFQILQDAQGRSEGGIQGGGVQCLQPSQLHQSKLEPAISADLRGVSGDYAAAVNAVRAALRVLTVSAEGRRRKAIACPTSRLMVVVMMVV